MQRATAASRWNAQALQTGDAGDEIHALVRDILPYPRSLTGDGVRQTLARLARDVPLEMHEVASGTAVLDWNVPDEWTVRAAWIKGPDGTRIVDYAVSSLHLVGYSVPVHAFMPLAGLRAHLHTLPDKPGAVPYRTSYYTPQWGFCMTHAQLETLREGTYEVLVDTTLAVGHMSYGEYVKRGDATEEVLLSAHVCHPAMANDNCSGLALLATLARRLEGMRTRLSYRFLFAPGTIGAITWLATNDHRVTELAHGLVVSCVGDGGGPTYKRSRRGDAKIDRAMVHVLKHQAPSSHILDFSPYGYDERQYCSPGYDLPVGLFQRSLHGTFPQYHTSHDDLTLVRPEHLARSYALIVAALDVLERDRIVVSTCQKGEPQLGRRGLYRSVGGEAAPIDSMALLWVLNLADGRHGLLDMAERSGLGFAAIADAAAALERCGLVVADEGGDQEA